jgi:hypothetical protein
MAAAAAAAAAVITPWDRPDSMRSGTQTSCREITSCRMAAAAGVVPEAQAVQTVDLADVAGKAITPWYIRLPVASLEAGAPAIFSRMEARPLQVGVQAFFPGIQEESFNVRMK